MNKFKRLDDCIPLLRLIKGAIWVIGSIAFLIAALTYMGVSPT